MAAVRYPCHRLQHVGARACTSPREHVHQEALDKLNTLAEQGHVDGSLGIFRSIQARSPQTVHRKIWNTMLKACANAGDFIRARGIFEEMLQRRVQPNVPTFGKLIEASAKAGQEVEAKHWFVLLKSSDLSPSHVVYSSLIDAAAKSANVDSARTWLSEMKANCLTPNKVTYSALLNVAAKSGDLSLAEMWFRMMQDGHVKPDVISYTAILTAYAKVSDTQSLERRFHDMSNSGVPVDACVLNVMVDAFARSGNLLGAQSWFERMKSAAVDPDIRAYGALINGYAQLREHPDAWGEAEEIFATMERSGIQGTIVQYCQVLQSYVHATPPQAMRAVKWFEHMVSKRVHPNQVAFNIMYRLVGRKRAMKLCDEVGPSSERLMSDEAFDSKKQKRLLSVDLDNARMKENQRRKLR
mmetsp:Transcript_5001/g.18712  ORF Transcript_5001/g.18712 Transcript_5001/m.18712 type:complete len:412 (-) Transcript_5001:59-1294(-)